VDQIFVIIQLAEKFFEKYRVPYNNFIDFKQAFDSVWQRVVASASEQWYSRENGELIGKYLQ